MKYILKDQDKPAEILDTAEKYRSKLCSKIIGNLDSPQYINLRYDGSLGIAVADAGLLRNLPRNFFLRYDDLQRTVVQVVGPAVFYRLKPTGAQTDPYDFILDSLKREDIVLIEALLSEDFQTDCEKNFCDGESLPFTFHPISDDHFKKIFGKQ